MAALSADRVTRRRDDNYEHHPDSYPVLAGAVIFYGALCSLDVNGFIQPIAASDNRKFALVALQFVDNTSGASGDVLVQASFGAAYHFNVDGGGMDRGNIGDPVYGFDDQTVTTVVGTNTPVGNIAYFEDAGTAWVHVKGPRA